MSLRYERGPCRCCVVAGLNNLTSLFCLLHVQLKTEDSNIFDSPSGLDFRSLLEDKVNKDHNASMLITVLCISFVCCASINQNDKSVLHQKVPLVYLLWSKGSDVMVWSGQNTMYLFFGWCGYILHCKSPRI